MKKAIISTKANRILSMILVIIMSLSIVPIKALAISSCNLSMQLIDENVIINEEVEFSVKITANDAQGTKVRGSIVCSDMSAIEKLEYKDPETDAWTDFYGYFSNENGFLLEDSVLYFRAIFKNSGTYSIIAEIIDFESNVIASNEKEINVKDHTNNENDNPVVIKDLNKFAVVGDEYKFTVTLNADQIDKNHFYALAVIKDGVDSQEYKPREYLYCFEYENKNKWISLIGNESLNSNANPYLFSNSGFDLHDGVLEIPFRAVFDNTGEYIFGFSLTDGKNTISECYKNISVKGKSDIKFTQENIKIKYTDKNKKNDTLVDAVEGAEYTYVSSKEDIVKVDKYGILTPNAVGSAIITVTRKETDRYVESTTTYSVEVIPGEQNDLIWNTTIPESICWTEKEFINTVSGGSGDGAVTYSSNNPEVATVNAETGFVTLIKPGEVVITAKKSGKDYYEDQIAEYILIISKANQKNVSFEEEYPNSICFGEQFTNVATGGSSIGKIIYKSSNEKVAVVDEYGVVTAKGFGQVTISAYREGDEKYFDSTNSSYNLTVNRAIQKESLNFEKGSGQHIIKYGEDFSNIVIGGKTKIEYSSSVSDVATVDENGKIKTKKSGITRITATAVQTDQYEAHTISYELVVELADQEVTFSKGTTNIPVISYKGSYQNEAFAKTNITYSSDDESIAEISPNGELIIHRPGKVKIVATAEQTEQYMSASNSYEITIEKGIQNISFEKGNYVEIVFNDNNNFFHNQAYSDAEEKQGIEVVYSIISGEEYIDKESFNSSTGEFTVIGAGMVVVGAEFSENDFYKLASSTYTLIINKDDQTISFEKDVYEMICGDYSFVSPQIVVPGAGTGDISYSVKEDQGRIIKSIDSVTGKLEFTYELGSAVIIATKSSDSNYNETFATYKLTVTETILSKVCYSIDGTLGENQWYTSDISILAHDGYIISYPKKSFFDEFEWTRSLPIEMNEGTNHVLFKIRSEKKGLIYESVNLEIKKDTAPPSVSIGTKDANFFDEFLQFIGIKKERISFVAEYSDATSGVAKVEYKIIEGSTEIKSSEELDNISGWYEYKDEIIVEKNKVFVLYVKVTDNAGNRTYATTNGVVFDAQEVPEENIVVDILTEKNNDYYNQDIEMNVKVTDLSPSSGLNSITYKVFNNGIKTQEEILFQFDIQNPTYDQLIPSWSSIDYNKKIIVDSTLNDSDVVEVEFTVVDNAKHTTTKKIPLKICSEKPKLAVEFFDDPNVINHHEGVDYYNENRTVNIIITQRTSVFDKSIAPKFVINEIGGSSINGITYEVIGWSTTYHKNNPNLDTHTYTIKFKGSSKYQFSVEYEDIIGNVLNYNSKSFVIDHDDPTASVTIDEYYTWDSLLKTISFGLWDKNIVTVVAMFDDETSPIKEKKMYKTNSAYALTQAQLNALYEKGEFEDYHDFSISEDEKFVLYFRVEDYAGHYKYICSDGFIVDSTCSEITIIPENTDFYHDGIPVYNHDVNVLINVKENKEDSYSGIKEIKYWIECNKVETYSETLYSFGYSMDDYYAENDSVPKYNELLHEFSKNITIKAAENNSCDVVIFVGVTDNAGNYYENNIAVDIDITKPKISVFYDNNMVVNSIKERGYFSENRKATIVITERTEHFEAEKAIRSTKIKAVDSDGAPIYVGQTQLYVDKELYIVDLPQLFGEIKWNTKKEENSELDTHTLTLNYSVDANYTFDISYTDFANNKNESINTSSQKAPFEFTIDKLAPSASISVGEKTWNKLLEVLTFGLYSNESVDISVAYDDDTTPSEFVFVECYKTSDKIIKTKEDLEKITEWTDIKSNPEFTINKDDKFAIYIKVTDYAGNRTYLNSDGYIIDTESANIELIHEHTDLYHNSIPLYNDDVDIHINIKENKAETYSGIKTIKYWIKCDGIETHSEVLYSLDYSMNDYSSENSNVPQYNELLHDFSKTITIEAGENNSCDVVLFVGVTDNAGNYSENSVNVDIDYIPPTISIKYDNNNPNKTVGEIGYYPENRIATIVITEREGHFDKIKASEGIKVKALDFYGNPISINNSMLDVDSDKYVKDISNLFENVKWDTQVSKSPDDTTHTLVLEYNHDANYEFEIGYADLANNCNNGINTNDSTTPYKFAIDTLKPTGSISVGEIGTWDYLIEFLTFGLWSKDSVEITIDSKDETTPIEPVYYYKISDVTAIDSTELNSISNWVKFNGLTIDPDEQFVVYVKIVDYAGNLEYISTNGIIVDDTIPNVESVEPNITITPEPTNGIYNDNVTISVDVFDPKIGSTNAFAGLKEIRYEVYNMGKETQSGVLFDFVEESPTYGELRQSWSKSDAIIVDKEKNNSNDVKIVVYAVDNADNENSAECFIKIDTTAPIINVTYDNNNGDTDFAESVYFNENRTAKIVVTERNFVPEMVECVLTNTDGFIPQITSWTTIQGAGNGDSTTHTAYIVFNKDGDYTFEISCADMAMNSNHTVDYNESLAPKAFTIDKTAPIVNISYDNNNPCNGNYYNDQRIATITVTEHNFETLSNRLKIKLESTIDGVNSKLPDISNWTSNDNIHTLTITYSNDSLYVFDFDYTDKAGNSTTDIAEQAFYVDKTNPVLKIENIVDQSANKDKGKIGFVVTALDSNFDIFEPVLTAVIKNGNTFETKILDIGEIKDIKNGKVFNVTNINDDGIYRLTCTVVDKAGNAFSEVTLEKSDGVEYVEQRSGQDVLITFSINRNGSAFELDNNTNIVVEQYYVQNIENDVVVVETNADSLKEYSVTLNGQKLEDKKDYVVTEEGGNGTWKKYTYKVNKVLFTQEGEYKLVISSKDKADNDAFSDVKDASVEFVVDRTAPVVTVSGLTTNGRYQTEAQVVTLIPTDDGGSIKSLVVSMVDDNGETIKEVINLVGKSLEEELEDNGGKVTFEISEGLYQNVRIVCSDHSVENSGSSNIYDTTIKNISVSSSMFMIFWANKVLRWGTIGGISLLIIGIILLVFLKKKKKKKNDN